MTRPVPATVRLLDAATIASLLCAETFAATVWPRMGYRWAVSPLYGVSLLLLAVRHLRWPRPSLPSRIASAATQAWKDAWTRRTTSVALATRAFVLGVGFAGALLIGQARSPDNFRLSHSVWLNLPARYDAGWYLGIARNGYEWWPELAHRQQNVVFFPGFPVAMRIAGDLVTLPARLLNDAALFGNGNTRVAWGGALVAMGAFALALVRLHRLASTTTGGADVAFRAVLQLACAPFAYFFSAPYSEGLFLLAIVSTFAAWKDGRLSHAAGWGLVAGFTRSNGWTLTAALAADLLARSRERPAWIPRLAVAMTPALAAVMFSAYIYTLTGHPLTWMTAQSAWGRQIAPLGFVTARYGHIQHIGLGTYVVSDPGDAVTVLCVLLMLGLSLAMLWRRQWMEATFTLAYLLPGTVIDIPSLGRMTAVLFPGYVTLATLLSRRLTWTLAAAFGALQLLFAFRFFAWMPPF
jgi:hypothetical protein